MYLYAHAHTTFAELLLLGTMTGHMARGGMWVTRGSPHCLPCVRCVPPPSTPFGRFVWWRAFLLFRLRLCPLPLARCFPPRFRLPPLLCGFRLRFRRALPLPPSAAPLPPGGRRKPAEALPLPPPSASAPPSLRRATHRPTTRRWRLVELSSAVVGSRGARRAGEVLSAPECSRAEGGSPASAFRFRPASARVFTLPAI